MDVNVYGRDRERDVEKGRLDKLQTEIKLSIKTEQAVLREYVRSSNVIGDGW